MTTAVRKSVDLNDVKSAKLAEIEDRIARLNGSANDRSNELLLAGRDMFKAANFPGRKDEDWKYTPVKPLFSRDYNGQGQTQAEATVRAQLDAYTYDLFNGQLESQDYSLPDNVFIGSWAEACANDRLKDVVSEVESEIRKMEMTAFESMGLALNPEITFIYLPKNAVLDKPIHLIHNNGGQDTSGIESNAFTIIYAERHSEGEIVETFRSASGSQNFTNTVARVFVNEGAKISHFRMQTESYDAFHVANTTVTQARDSVYGMYVAEFGGKLVRNNINVIHRGQNITSNLYGAFIARDRQHIDTQSFIDHAEPHCQSNEFYKGILLDYGRGVFNGKIIVRPDAQKTNAFQQNAALVMSPNATIDSKPQLEIFADDVRCSHGATIGQLDKESLFYLMSRGLTEDAATELLKRAFLKDVISQFPSENILNYFEVLLENELRLIAQNKAK